MDHELKYKSYFMRYYYILYRQLTNRQYSGYLFNMLSTLSILSIIILFGLICYLKMKIVAFFTKCVVVAGRVLNNGGCGRHRLRHVLIKFLRTTSLVVIIIFSYQQNLKQLNLLLIFENLLSLNCIFVFVDMHGALPTT